MNVTEFPLRISGIAGALQARAAAAAADAMAAEFHTVLTDVTLRTATHRAATRTPSAPGQPPALVTGTLRRSARIVPAVASGPRAVSSVRMGTVYARIQELGGDISVKRAKVLYNKRTKQAFGTHVRLPARPYMKPTRDALLASRRLQMRAAQAVAAVAREAAGG